jgi:RNA polymerase sigma-70 factor (ECF subfamily)
MNASPAQFATTHWSVVLTAGQTGAPQAAESLERLCCAYWYPLYSYLRRRGRGPHDAEDLVQGFFERLVQGDYLQSVEQDKGRFRSFLLMALNRYVSDVGDRGRALKRGGGQAPVSLDDPESEARYCVEPVTHETPERIYERRWALAVMERAMRRLQAEFAAAARQRQFEALKEFLAREREETGYAAVAAQLGMTPGAVAVAVHRLRRRYRELVLDEIAQTLANPAEAEDEMRYLFCS